MTALALLAALLLLAMPASAAVTTNDQAPVFDASGRRLNQGSGPANGAFTGSTGNATSNEGSNSFRSVSIAFIEDVQNIFTVGDPDNFDRAYSIAIANALVAQIKASKPSIVVFLGDLTDSTGSDVSYALDPNDLGVIDDQEWVDFKAYLYDPLIAAGLSVMLSFGNHDSCVDVLRWFPISEWTSRPWHYSEFVRAGLCGTPGVDLVVNRAGLFHTAIGDICVIATGFWDASGGQPWVKDAAEIAWVNSQVGCGANVPTIMAAHYYNEHTGWMLVAANQEIFSVVKAHVVPVQAISSVVDNGTIEYISTVGNHQEVAECNNLSTPRGVRSHTGLGWWFEMVITPIANTVAVTYRRPFVGVAGNDSQHFCTYLADSVYNPLIARAYTNNNQSLSLATPWCTRFPGGPGC